MGRYRTCESCRRILHEYADGRLKARKRQAVEMHLAACADCRDSVQEILGLRRLVAGGEAPPPSAGFWERCMQTVAATAKPKRMAARGTWKTAFGIAAAGALVALAIWFAPARSPLTPSQATRLTAQAEIPDWVYTMHHARFAAAKSLGFASQHALVSARAGEGRMPDLTSDTE